LARNITGQETISTSATRIIGRYLPTNNNNNNNNNNVIIYQLLIRLVAAVRAKWDGHRKNNNNNKWYALRSGDNGARPVWPP